MSIESPLSSQRLTGLNDAAIVQAGPRYTPGLDPRAPNLEVTGLVRSIDALSYSTEFRKRLETLAGMARDAWRKSPAHLKREFSRATATPDSLARLIEEIGCGRPGDGFSVSLALSRQLSKLEQRLGKYLNQNYELVRTTTSDEEKKSARSNVEDIRRLQSEIDDIREYVNSPDFDLLSRNVLFVRGGWGAGKTHLLCDIAKGATETDHPALLLLAQTFAHHVDPLEAAAEAVQLGSADELLRSLDQLGLAKNSRALLIIDGINEGDRVAWSKHIASIADRISSFPNVGLVLSCRTPFERQILNDATTKSFVHVEHNGFLDMEYDAQREFFTYYDIPIPHVPLLASEFSKPLFLKILCQTLASLSRPARKRRINDFAAGNKGMTKLLEDFVRTIGLGIENSFGVRPMSCWYILKGEGESNSAIGLAPIMAERGVDYVSREDCRDVVTSVTNLDPLSAESFITHMVNEGLLVEEGRWQDGWHEVIRMSYQRFSDHLVTRHLLARYLDATNEATIRRSFYKNRPLGRLFDVDEWGDYRLPNIVSAIILEFPERVKRSVPLDRNEIFEYLPKKRQTTHLIAPFIEGLLWRSTSSFSARTESVIDLISTDERLQDLADLWEALVCLGSREKHPLNARYLHDRLRKMSLPDRDLAWTEYLRQCGPGSAVYRVMDWIERKDAGHLSKEVVLNLITLIGIFCTSTNRLLRDRATRSLVLLGDYHPDVLMAATTDSFEFGDPYVPERMLAAAYGSMMRSWAFPTPHLRTAASTLATNLDGRLAGSGPYPLMEHILMREYAEGIVLLSRRMASRHADTSGKPSRRPLVGSSRFPSPESIPSKVIDQARRAIHMDFGNYTIGRLVDNRSNYDYDNKEYKEVLKLISWRIIDLGYDGDKFQAVDRIIGARNFRAESSSDGPKVDRYGKKYSWIAFFEVAGKMDMQDRLPGAYDARISDVDLDPSFPDRPLEWRPPLAELFDSSYADGAGWLASGPSPDYSHLLQLSEVDGLPGPWVLLDGYISQAAISDPREAFTFLRGLILDADDLPRLDSLVRSTDYLGNSAIPDPPESHYLFAGEIGSSPKFGSRNPINGEIAPYIDEVLEQKIWVTATKKFSELEPWERVRFRASALGFLQSDFRDAETPSEDSLVEVEVFSPLPGVRAEVPVWRYGWESHHSQLNDGHNPVYPSPAMVNFLNLKKRGAKVDLVDSSGKAATVYREWRIDRENSGNLLYVRADLLTRYLSDRKGVLAWISWGERSLHYDTLENLREDPTVRAVWDQHSHIHKRFASYSDRGAVLY